LRYPYVSGENIWISAKEGAGLDELLGMIKKHIFSDYVVCSMLIPFDRGDLVSYLNEHASVESTSYEEEGTLVKVELKKSDYDRLQEFTFVQE